MKMFSGEKLKTTTTNVKESLSLREMPWSNPWQSAAHDLGILRDETLGRYGPTIAAALPRRPLPSGTMAIQLGKEGGAR